MLNKVFMLCFLFLFFQLKAMAFLDDNISILEYSKYGTNYQNESLGERLNRLETDYFGMAQTGDIQSRLDNLSKINSTSKNGIIPFQNENYYNKKQKKSLKTFWDNLFSDGYMTGFTPSLNSTTVNGYGLNNYNNYMNNNRSFCPYNNTIHNRNPIKNNRYYDNKFNNNFNGVNRLTPYRKQGKRHKNFSQNYNPYNQTIVPTYNQHTSYYSPPNIETKSSIHIIRD